MGEERIPINTNFHSIRNQLADIFDRRHSGASRVGPTERVVLISSTEHMSGHFVECVDRAGDAPNVVVELIPLQGDLAGSVLAAIR